MTKVERESMWTAAAIFLSQPDIDRKLWLHMAKTQDVRQLLKQNGFTIGTSKIRDILEMRKGGVRFQLTRFQPCHRQEYSTREWTKLEVAYVNNAEFKQMKTPREVARLLRDRVGFAVSVHAAKEIMGLAMPLWREQVQ